MLLLFAVGLEALAGLRALVRMAATAGGSALEPAAPAAPGILTAIVPVLDEEARLGATLDALGRVGPVLAAILVVDGGSTDGTRAVVAEAAARDPRIRLLDGAPTPGGWNGKAWNLAVGLDACTTTWVATVDADVRAGAALFDAALARIAREGLAALSVATRQELPDRLSALLHPALLTTLVYRAGLPNVATGDPARVQANGQVFVARSAALRDADALRAARASRCEDVTVARILAARGGRIGFYEGDAVVRMHDSWHACAANWPRSLTLRDGFVGPGRLALTLAGLLFAQALPLPTLVLALALGARLPNATLVTGIAFALVAMRAGVLFGTRRAYVRPSLAYWFSPLADLPAIVLLVHSALRRRHVWRGRTLVTEGTA